MILVYAMSINKIVTSVGVIVFALSLICGCKRNGSDVEVISEYSTGKTLVGDTIVPELGEYLTYGVETAGDFYVVATRQAKFKFSVYDKDFNLIDTIVRKGQGPDELSDARYYGQNYGTPEDPSVLVMDGSRLRLVEMRIHPFAGLTTKVVFPISLGLDPHSAFMVNDTIFAGVNLMIGKPASLFRYNAESKTVEFADDGFEYNHDTEFMASQRGVAISSDGEVYAEAFYAMPCICIFDRSLKLKKKLFFGKEVNPKFLSMDEKNYGFNHIEIYGDKIVGLLIEPKDKDNRLIVLSSDGELLASYGIGKARWFCIDDKYDRIVTPGYNDELDMVVFAVIPLPDELKN